MQRFPWIVFCSVDCWLFPLTVSRYPFPFTLTLLLVLTLPFESIWSLLQLPWVQFTNLELLLAATAIAWGIYLARRQPGTIFTHLLRQHWSSLLPLLAFLAIALLSALLAPTHAPDALKLFTRFANGAFAYLLAQTIAGKSDYVRQLLWAIVVGAGLSALVGLGEAAGWSWLNPLLQLFKRQPTYVGNTLRISASFQYATIAAIFLEMAAAVALTLAATGSARRRWLATAIATLCTLVAVLTLTRAGIFSLALIYLFLFLLTRRWHMLRPLRLPLLLSGATLLVATLLLAFHSPEFRARLSQETDNAWYQASYHVPAHIALPAGQAAPVTIQVTNDSPVFWQASGPFPIRLRYRWLTADGQSAFALPFGLHPLPHDLPPGETIALTIPLQPPLPPGNYRLAWGLEHADRFWFHHRGVPDVESAVTITAGNAGSPAAPPTQPRSDQTGTAAAISRQQLWTAACAMFRQRPLLGVGPGNFRHLYGSYLGLDQWDRGIHANSLYLELLADTGALGLLSFTALLLIIGCQTIHFYRRLPASPPGDAPLWAIGLSSAILIFLLHGFFDYFLEFVPTYLLFWLCLGFLSGITAPTTPT
ncbi:MAG: hypothetical protein Fur0021_40690 [Candidatus Promineifilaceae bacterium]